MRTSGPGIRVCSFLFALLAPSVAWGQQPLQALQAPSAPQAILASESGADESLRKRPELPRRFLGWNYPQSLGDKYFEEYRRYFSRPPVDAMLPQALNKLDESTLRLFSQQASVLGELPGFAFRPSLPAGFLPTAVAAGDFNNDGRPDFVVANAGNDNLWLFLGRGDGTFELPTIIELAGLSPIHLATADLQGDNNLDLIVAQIDTKNVGVLLGRGDGTFFDPTNYPTPRFPTFVLAGDFNGDTHPDVVCALTGFGDTGVFTFFPGTGTGLLGTPLSMPFADNTVSSSLSLSAADLNGDGKLDVVSTSPGISEGVRVYLNNGNGTFARGQQITSSNTIPSTGLADLNEDSCPDAIVLTTFGLAWVYRGNCDGTFDNMDPNQRPVGLGDISWTIAFADLNSDGHLDLVSSGFFATVGGVFGQVAGNLVMVAFGDGTGKLSSAGVYQGDVSMFSLALADFNLDGHLDLVTANQDGDSATTYLNDGQGGFGPPQGRYIGALDGTGAGSTNVSGGFFLISDVDANGASDMVVYPVQQLSGEPYLVSVSLNDSSGKFSAAIVSDGPAGDLRVGDLVLADFRNTGRPDLLAVGQQFDSNTDFVAFAPNIGGGSFGPVVRVQPPWAAGVVGVGDFNSPNLFANDTNGNTIDVVLRDRQAGATTPVSLTDTGAQTSEHAGGCGRSTDGRFICFTTESPAVAADSNGFGDGFLRDTCFGAPLTCMPSTVRVTVSTNGSQGNNHSSGPLALSGDGRFVVFRSQATNMIAGQTLPAGVLYIARTGQ